MLSILAAITNYSLYPILSRILNSQNFGDFAVVTSLSNQLLGIILAISIMSIYFVKSLPEPQARQNIETVQKVLMQIFFVSIFAVLGLSPLIRDTLNVEKISSFVLLGLILLTSIPSTIWTGYLQGHKELVRVGVYNLGAGLAKVTFASILAVYWGTTGAIAGVAISGLVGLLILHAGVGIKLPSLRGIFSRLSQAELNNIRKVSLYLIECILVVGALSFLQNFDITLAKYLFSSEVAGVYSGVSILSNALYYLAFLIIWIVLPEITLDDPSNNKRVLVTAYRLIGLLAVGALSFTYLFRADITARLLGNQFSGQGTILLLAIFYQLSLVAISLYSLYLLATRNRDGLILAVLTVIPAMLLPIIWAKTAEHMIQLLAASMWIGGVSFAVYRGLSIGLHRRA